MKKLFTQNQIAKWFIETQEQDLHYIDEIMVIRRFLEETEHQQILSTDREFIEGVLDIIFEIKQKKIKINEKRGLHFI
jgi:hypothetical protein